MLAADHKVVRQLLTRFAIARIAHAEKETADTARELAEVTSALCAAMGRTSIYEAIAAADAWLATRSRPVVSDRAA